MRNKLIVFVNKFKILLSALYFLIFGAVVSFAAGPTIMISETELGFKPPNLGTVLTFVIRLFFVIAGLAALLFLLTGALSWVTSGGSKENVDKAREKIQAAVIGVILIVVVLSVIVTMEEFVFDKKICFGISCPITIPTLLKPPGS